jgi:hypothetical protein
VARDEKKHTGLAVLYLPSVLKKMGRVQAEWLRMQQVYWTFCITRSIWNHRREADALGIDISAQDHLVEQMGIRRGIFKNRTLERIVIGMYKPKEGTWTRAPSSNWSRS